MKTGKSVEDGQLTDEQIGKLYRRVGEIKRRIDEHTIDYVDTMDVLQKVIIEGKSGTMLKLLEKPKWNVWRKIDAQGTLKAEELVERLMNLNPRAKEDETFIKILREHPYLYTNTTKSSFRFVRVTVADLGLTKGGTFRDICKQALSLGLSFCGTAAVYQLRLNYLDQPLNECLNVGMLSITTRLERSIILRLENPKGEFRIGFNLGFEQVLYSSNDEFVFEIQ